MPCEECLPKLRGLRAMPSAVPVLDPESDAFVWPDERVDLCAECAREYRVVLNVRMQFWNGERPSADFRMVWDRFREECPLWIGFERRGLLNVPRSNRVAGIDEVRDED